MDLLQSASVDLLNQMENSFTCKSQNANMKSCVHHLWSQSKMTEDITDLTTNEETNTQPTSTQPISVVNSCSEISGLVGGVLEA